MSIDANAIARLRELLRAATPGPLRGESGYIWAIGKFGERMFAQMRGWGYLTGHADALGLSEAEAIAIQDRDMQALVEAYNAAPALLDERELETRRANMLAEVSIKLQDKLVSQSADLERMRKALGAIAAFKGKTLISTEHGQPYSEGANAAFEELAEIALAALSIPQPPKDTIIP